MNKKRLKIGLITILLIPILCGYTFTDDMYYVDVNCALGNNIKIHFAEDVIDYVKIEGTNIINTRQSTIYGYTTNNRITFPVFELPYYSVNYTNIDLGITAVNEVHFRTTITDILKHDALFYIFLLLGGLYVWLIMTRS